MRGKRPSGKRPTTQPATGRPSAGFVAVAFVRAPHGVRGEIAVEPLTDFPDRFLPGARLWAAGVKYTVRGARAHRDVLLLELEGVDDRRQADTLRGRMLEVPERDLPALEQDEYFRFEIVGIAVVDTEGNPLGRVEEVLETGANDVYIVRDADTETLLPAIDSVVKEIDLDARRMVVELIPGLERRRLKRGRQPSA